MRYSGLWFIVACVFVLGSFSAGYSPHENVYVPQSKALGDGPELPFDPNDFDFLIYDCQGGENSIAQAMTQIGLTYTVRNSSNPVTMNDLTNHDVLIVGWSSGGDKSGLDTSIIEQGITGRVILSGHDSDYHTVNGPAYAETFFIQEIEYVLQGEGTGLIVCADIDDNFNWLPESWGVTAEVNGGQHVTAITQDGWDSGVYDDLDPNKLSNWGTAYHNTFEHTGFAFRTFEIDDDNRAVTIASPASPYGVIFTKVDDVDEFDCISPTDELTYTISWENTTGQTIYDVTIIDYLPDGVTYPGSTWQMNPNNFFDPIPPDPNYSPHFYTWTIGDLEPNNTGSVTLTVVVNERAEPGLTLENIVTLMSGDMVIGWASEQTNVCCWDTVDPNIIYVDEKGTGYNNGTNWQDAYTDLQSALRRARDAACEVGPYTVYVAQGTYSPGDYVKDSFELPDGLSMYGGFKNGGCELWGRNPDRYITTLTGNIGVGANNEVVVMMGDDTRLDGFVIEAASNNGIYNENSSATVESCLLANNLIRAIYSFNGDLTLSWCKIQDNENGVYQFGGNNIVTYCEIVDNGGYGIFTEHTVQLQIKNSVIAGCSKGVRIATPTEIPVLYNNTIAYNTFEGISFTDDDPNVWERDYPDIQNCILWFNNDDGEQIVGYSFTQYSCVFDPNDPDGTDYTLDAYGNFSGNPGFAYEHSDDPNVVLNIHLAYDSPCINKGSESLPYTGQLDIDGEERVVGQRVDIGADEVYSCDDDLTEDDISNPVDWTADGIVNFHEYAIFAEAWLSADPNNPLCDPNHPDYVGDPNDPNYISEDDKLRYKAECDLDTDLDVDLADLSLFCDEWLWIACWRESQFYRFDMMATGGGESMMMNVPFAEALSTLSLSEPEEALAEADLARLVHGINEIMAFVDETISEDPVNASSLLEIKASMAEILLELYYSNAP